MAWRVARSLLYLRGEINTRWPDRSKVSDGLLGDASHATRESDHNPWWVDRDGVGVVRALDVTVTGIPYRDVVEQVRQLGRAGDRRLNPGGYVISDGQIASAASRWEWRPYRGPNPHRKHFHVSAARAPTFDEPGSWLAPLAVPIPPAVPVPFSVEDDAVKVTLVPLVQHDGPWWVGWVATPLAVAATLHGPELDTDPTPTVGGPWRYLVDAGAPAIQDRGPEGDRPQRAVVTVELPYALPGDEILVRVAHA